MTWNFHLVGLSTLSVYSVLDTNIHQPKSQPYWHRFAKHQIIRIHSNPQSNCWNRLHRKEIQMSFVTRSSWRDTVALVKIWDHSDLWNQLASSNRRQWRNPPSPSTCEKTNWEVTWTLIKFLGKYTKWFRQKLQQILDWQSMWSNRPQHPSHNTFHNRRE